MSLPLDYQLRTPRLCLRRFTVADAVRVCEIQSNWNVARMLRLASYPPTVESIGAWLAEHEAEWLSGKAFRFAVLFNGHLIGCSDVDGRWCVIERWAACIPWPWGSGEALGYRHAEAGHDVDDLAASRGFGLLRWQSPSVEAAANQGFVAHHGDLAQ